MAKLGIEDHRHLEELQKRCAADLAPNELGTAIGRRFARYTGSDGYWVLLFDPGSRLPCDAIGHSGSAGSDHEVAERFLERFSRYDWGRCTDADGPIVRIFNGEPGAEAGGEELPRACNRGPEAQLLLTEAGRLWGCLVLFRRPGEREFEPKVERLLEASARCLTRGFQRAHAAALLTALPGSREAVILLGNDGRFEALSEPRAELLEGVDLATGHGLPIALRVVCTLLGDALGRDQPFTPRDVAFVDSRSGERYVAHGELLRRADGRHLGLVTARPLRALDDREALSRLGLTRRESDVTLTVLRGFTTSGAARLLELSSHTVEHHLSRVFEKLGVTTRAELSATLYGG